MKKSQQYKMAQMAVMDCGFLAAEAKLEILRTLIENEDMEIWREKEKGASQDEQTG